MLYPQSWLESEIGLTIRVMLLMPLTHGQSFLKYLEPHDFRYRLFLKQQTRLGGNFIFPIRAHRWNLTRDHIRGRMRLEIASKMFTAEKKSFLPFFKNMYFVDSALMQDR